MFSFSVSTLLSDTDDESNATHSGPFTQLNNSQKKWKSNTTANHSNKSFTSYFFRKDEDNFKIVYCQICENNLSGCEKPYPYTRKGGNTTIMINYLQDKHNVIKDNYTQYLNENGRVSLLNFYFIKFDNFFYIW